jgi:hypothetical protein
MGQAVGPFPFVRRQTRGQAELASSSSSCCHGTGAARAAPATATGNTAHTYTGTHRQWHSQEERPRRHRGEPRPKPPWRRSCSCASSSRPPPHLIFLISLSWKRPSSVCSPSSSWRSKLGRASCNFAPHCDQIALVPACSAAHSPSVRGEKDETHPHDARRCLLCAFMRAEAMLKRLNVPVHLNCICLTFVSNVMCLSGLRLYPPENVSGCLAQFHASSRLIRYVFVLLGSCYPSRHYCYMLYVCKRRNLARNVLPSPNKC